MSAVTEHLGKRILLSQAYLIVYSALAAIVGRGKLLWLVIILFFILMIIVQSRLGGGPLGQGRVKAEEVEAGRTLHEENDVRELQMNDKELAVEMQEHSKATMMLSFGTFISLAYFFLLWSKISSIESYLAGKFGIGPKTAMFLAFLIYFEGVFIINQLFLLYTIRRIGKMPVLNMPQGFKITEKGIILKGLVSRQAITFPLPSDVEVVLNEKRKFVELVKHGKRSVTRIRLYTKSPRKVYSLITSLNERSRGG
ncbi:DUF2208 family protein [Stetteria hydrogenophila]